MNSTVARTRRARAIDLAGVLALVMGLVVGILPPGVASASHGAGALGPTDFEIDGNLTVGSGHDWNDIATYADESLAETDATGNADSTWFKAGTKEQHYPGWVFDPGGNAPKSDLIHTFVASQLDGDNSWIWLAASRVSDNGNTQVSIEFNQSEVTDLTGSYRTPGDVYIRFNFPGKQSTDTVTVGVSQWTGGTGAYPAPTTLPAGAFSYALGGIEGGTTDFIELQLDLDYIFSADGGLGLGCQQFGSVDFRTESSGGSDNNNDPTLKDVAGPYPIDLDTCEEVSVKKVDEEGNPLAGAEFTLYEGSDTSGALASGDGVTNPCTTDATGECSFGFVTPGTYTVDETVVPAGYEKAANLPWTFGFEDLPLPPFEDPRKPYSIDVSPDQATNALDDTDSSASRHKFTVTLTSDGSPVANESVDLEWTGGVGEIVEVDTVATGGVSSTTCTTDAAGTCDVWVNTGTAGGGTLTASWDTPYQNTVSSPAELPSTTATDGTPDTIPYPTIADSGDKDWVGLDASIEETATNLLGDPHTFEIYVWEVDGEGADDGTEVGSAVAGADVAVSWSGPAGSGIINNDCADNKTGSDGTCTVTVDSNANGGTGTLTIDSVSGAVTGGETAVTTFGTGDRTADKTWRIYRATIDEDSVNPAGQKHTFKVTVEYSDDNGATWENPGAGLTVEWTGPTPDGTNHADSTCDDTGTDTNGTCTIVVTSPTPGEGTVTVTTVNGDLVPGGTTSESFDVPQVQAKKTWLGFTVDIDGPYVNLVGEPETFTVTVKKSDGGAYVPVTDGSILLWTDSGDSRVTGDTCSVGGTQNGECTITVMSATTGTMNISVTGIDDYVDFDDPVDVTFGQSADTAKTWVDYRAFIAADGVNLVGDEHEFEVTAQYDDGTGWKAVPDGTAVTVTASGLAAGVDQTDCNDGTSGGTCTVVVDSDDPGTVTITVATVANTVAVDSTEPSVDVSDGSNLTGELSASADKTWIAYRAGIEASATNLTGQAHVFDVTAEQNDGTGWTAVPDETEVSFTPTGAPVTGDTCGSTSGGACTITVDSASVASVTVTITGVSAEDVDGDPTATVANGALTAYPTQGSLSATKDWIEVRVDVDADETNIRGESHQFTVDVEIVTPGGTFDAPAGTTVAVTPSGTTGSIQSQTCDDPGTSGGTCTVTVDSSGSGNLTITADSVSFTWDGTAFPGVSLTGVEGVASGQDRTATKTWRDYRVDIEADGFNAVRDPHQFKVTIEQTDVANPAEDDWEPVPNGTTATVAIASGPGQLSADTCDDPGTDGGTCSVTLTSATAGTTVVTVSEISVAHPETQALTPVNVTDDSADKVWIAFRGEIDRDSANIVGDDHVFHVNVEYTTDGSTWTQVPDTSVVQVSDNSADTTSVGAIDATTCGSTTATAAAGTTPAHVCTVTVASDESGSLTVTVDGVTTADITANGITKSFDVTFADQAQGVLDGFDGDDYEATKTWASYALDLTPDRAVNLLPVDPDHVFTAVLTSDDAVNAPVGGQDIAVTISGAVGTITAIEAGSVAVDGLSATCTTSDDGTCDITVTSPTQGEATIDASYDAQIGDSASVEIVADPSTKIWTTYRVTVEADAVNVVGNPHTFTVTVEQSNPDAQCDGDWCAVAGVFPTSEVTGSATIVDNDCVDNGTGADGTCTVTILSSQVETVVLTATYEASLGEFAASFNDTGEKTWVDYDLTVTPDVDENLVGTDHVFTVTITTTFPTEGGPVTAPVEGAVPTVELTGQGAITDNGCAVGTDATGQCEVTITSAAPGDSTLTATWLGTTDDDAKGKSVSDSGDKLWVDYELVIDPELATNAVGDDHTFTATLTVDTGEGFGPAAGETLEFSVDGVGDVIGGDVDGDLRCTTDEAGQCDIVIVSDVGGTTDVGVKYGAEVGDTSATFADEGVKQWVDIDLVKTAVVGDGFGDGDLVADPGSGLPTLFFTSSDRGPKTAVYEYTVTNTGGATLVDVVLTDDRLGTIIAAEDGVTLEPGESTTVRASELFDYDDAAGGLEPIIVNVGVVTASGDDGSEVSDTDDAAIQLVAQQSSILLDLVKEVVADAGDVDSSGGPPTVTWSQDDLAAGATKVVRYRLTVTNVGPSRIVDVELVDPMLGSEPLIAVSDGVTLDPGESTVVEVDHLLTIEQAFPDGPVAGEVPNVATARGANETRDSFDEDVDDALVLVQVVLGEVEERQLPATGLAAGGLAPLAALLILLGGALLAFEHRRVRRR